MKTTVIFTILFLTASTFYCQVKNDSLLSVWKDNTQSDSLRIDAYSSYIKKGFSESNPEEAFKMAEVLMTFGKGKINLYAQAHALNIQGSTWSNRSDYPKALEYYARSLKIREKMKA